MKKIFVFIIGFVSIISLALYALWTWLPTPQDIRGCMVTTMYEVNLCPGSANYAPLKSISPYLQKVVVLTEDSNFYNHKGFDWKAIEKNARAGWESGVFKRGGSTISQQLTKNLYLNKDRTFFRKALEAIITDRIEHTLTKNEILERYLNVVEFGKNIYGVKAAAQHYFKKTPAELNIVESSFLAMVLPNPVKYSQSYYRKELTSFAQKRLTEIINNMYQYHRINEEEYNTATYQLANFFRPEGMPEGMEVSDDEMMTLEELEATPDAESEADEPAPFEEAPPVEEITIEDESAQ